LINEILHTFNQNLYDQKASMAVESTPASSVIIEDPNFKAFRDAVSAMYGV